MPTKRQKPACNYDLLPEHGLSLKADKFSMIIPAKAKLSVLRNTQRLKFIVCDRFVRQSDGRQEEPLQITVGSELSTSPGLWFRCAE